MDEKDKSSRGELTIEATIVTFFTLCVVVFIINISFVVYHVEMTSAIANQAASDVAAIYPRAYKEPFFGYMTRDCFMDYKPYRYWGNDLEDKNIDKAIWYACYYTYIYEMGTSEGAKYPGITVSMDKNLLKQREITVNVKLTYPVLIANPLMGVGFDPKYTVDSSAKAICVDPTHDMNCTRMYSEIYNKIIGISNVGGIANNLVELGYNIKELIGKIKG